MNQNYNIVSRELEMKKKGEGRGFPLTSTVLAPRQNQFGPNHLQLLSEHDFNHHMKKVRVIAQDHSRPVNMSIQKGSLHITKLTLNKTAFALGDLIKGIFDFSEASERSRCCQVSIRLETEEKIESSFVNPKRGDTIYKIIAESHHPTQNSSCSSFSFQIPTEGIFPHPIFFFYSFFFFFMYKINLLTFLFISQGHKNLKQN